MNKNNTDYNPDKYWRHVEMSYTYYPTIRHRKRFVINQLKKRYDKDSFIFDYGCGIGGLLADIRKKFGHPVYLLSGCDISKIAVDIAKEKTGIQNLFNGLFPVLERKCDIITCIEVIEHTKDYLDILKWIFKNLKEGGTFILSTQSGKIHASDLYTGHTQHFYIKELNAILKELGFSIDYSALWGFPLFTMQKYLTDSNPDFVKNKFLEGDISFRKKAFFNLAYMLYYLHDIIDYGPQIYIVASKGSK